MNFHVGQKVVCVDDADQRCDPGDAPVVKGEVYTVREAFDFFGMPGIRIKEIRNPKDRGYHQRRFVPLTETKSKISFTEGAPLDSEKWDNRVPQKVRA